MTDPTDEKPEEDFAAMLAESEAGEKRRPRIRTGDLVRGRVVVVGAQSAFVAIGGKAEAVIDLAEFRDAETGEVRLAVGDKIEATVTDDGSRSGSIVLKRTLGRGGHVPGELEQALEHGIAVEGVVTGQNKGGFDVQIAGQRAFCPAGQIDMRRNDPAQYVGQRLRFRVTRIESGGRNIVVSRRQLLEDEAATQAVGTWERLEVGAVVTGTVTSIRDFGAFVDIGGVDGLIHVSELGYSRVENPADVLQVGQTVEAQVVKLEPDSSRGGRGRVGLSLRALAADPWETVTAQFPPGSVVRGQVKRLEAFGAFVEIAPGIEGLVHVSRLTEKRVSHARQAVNVGDEVEVTVLSIEPEKRRIALSMIEAARRGSDATARAEGRETAEIMARTSKEAKSLGTFGDLLAGAKKGKG